MGRVKPKRMDVERKKTGNQLSVREAHWHGLKGMFETIDVIRDALIMMVNDSEYGQMKTESGIEIKELFHDDAKRYAVGVKISMRRKAITRFQQKPEVAK